MLLAMYKAIVVAVMSVLTALGIIVAPAAFATRVPNNTTTMCNNHDWKWVNHGKQVVNNEVFMPGIVQCLTNTNDGSNFRVSSTNQWPFDWNTYPTIYYGDWYGAQSQHGSGQPLPEQVYKLPRHLWVTNRTTFPARAQGNDALDWWFNTTRPTNAHPNAAEVMVWQRWSSSEPTPPHAQFFQVGVHKFYLIHGVGRLPGVAPWSYIQFRLYHQNGNFTNFDMKILLDWAVRNGYIKPWWWAQSFNSGFEGVQNLTGAGVQQYNIRGF